MRLMRAQTREAIAARIKRARDAHHSRFTLRHRAIQALPIAAKDQRLLYKALGAEREAPEGALRFCWKRGTLAAILCVPTERAPKSKPDWYSEAERDRFLAEMFARQPRWYLFFYLSARLGLRVSEVYAIARSRLRDIPPQLIIDRGVQRGTKDRPAMLVSRKNNEAYSLDVTEDILDAIRWHIRQGYAGPEFLFSKDGTFPRYIDSYKRPMVAVQRALGLRPLSHHALGRHSVASQAVTSGHSIKAVQAQLGHRSEQSTHVYAHLGSRAQLRLVEGLQPAAAPHGTLRAPSKKKGT
jgi:integrase